MECHWKCGIKHYIGKKIGTSKLTTKAMIGAWRMPSRIILESFFKEALITSLDVSLKTSYKNTNCQHKMGMLGNVHKIHKLEGLLISIGNNSSFNFFAKRNIEMNQWGELFNQESIEQYDNDSFYFNFQHFDFVHLTHHHEKFVWIPHWFHLGVVWQQTRFQLCVPYCVEPCNWFPHHMFFS